METNENTETESAVFNMALDTLKRLGKNLEEQKNLVFKTEYSTEVQQVMKIGLVKQFFVQASPLLPEDTVKKYKTEVLKLRPKMQQVRQQSVLGCTEVVGNRLAYSEELEIRMDEITIELQMIIQKEKYFMPSVEDEGDF